MGRINNIWYYLSRHKYFITIVVCVVLVGVVDENSVRSLVMLSMQLSEKKEQLRSYEEQFERDSRSLSNFEAGLKGVETIARERYKMKRPDEDVFVLSTEKNIGREDE